MRILLSWRYLIVLLVTAGSSTSIYSQRHMTTPEFLQKGDTVALVATARKIELESLRPAISLLEKWGLHVVIGASIGAEEHQLAGSDSLRAADFQKMIDDPSVKAVWAAKGGYGTVRFIDAIDFTRFRQKPKWVIGFSDMTVLHSHLNNMGIETVHGIMAFNAKTATPAAIETLRKALFGETLQYNVPSHPYNKPGKVSGELVGGNLSVLYSILGSASQVDCRDKILFIEDLDEYLYHIDRMMMNLKRNGWFQHVKGVVVGGMTEMNDNQVPWGKDALQIIQDIFKDYDFPVIYNFPAGHIRDNRALIFGKQIEMDVRANGASVIFQ